MTQIAEILPGVLHWKAMHPSIRMDVSSYYLERARTLIDPMEPDEGAAWFGRGTPPERIVLTNRHHYRASDKFREELGCPVLCHESGLHEFEEERFEHPPPVSDSAHVPAAESFAAEARERYPNLEVLVFTDAEEADDHDAFYRWQRVPVVHVERCRDWDEDDALDEWLNNEANWAMGNFAGT